MFCISFFTPPTEFEGKIGMILAIRLSLWSHLHCFVCPSHFWGFHTFPDKQVWTLTSDLMDTFTMCYVIPQARLTFGCTPLNLLRFLASDWKSSFRTFADWIEVKFGRRTRYRTPQTWLTFGHSPMNYHHFFTSDLLRSFHAFPFTTCPLGPSQTKLNAGLVRAHRYQSEHLADF